MLSSFRQLLAEVLPRILSQCCRDPNSPAYGCFDRNFWHYRMRDFASIILQQGGYAVLQAQKALPDGPLTEDFARSLAAILAPRSLPYLFCIRYGKVRGQLLRSFAASAGKPSPVLNIQKPVRRLKRGKGSVPSGKAPGIISSPFFTDIFSTTLLSLYFFIFLCFRQLFFLLLILLTKYIYSILFFFLFFLEM